MIKTSRQARREAKRMFRLCLVNGLLDEERTREVVQRVIDSRRRGGLKLLSHFERFVRLHRERHTAEVESAVAGDLRARIQAGLARTYGPGISAEFTHNPGLIGGMRVKVGSDVLDGSVRGRLAAMENRF